MPQEFAVSVFADGLPGVRNLVVADNGDVFAVQSDAGIITRLHDPGHQATATERNVYAKDFAYPYGLAFAGGYLYVADEKAVWQLQGDGPRIQITADNALSDKKGPPHAQYCF